MQKPTQTMQPNPVHTTLRDGPFLNDPFVVDLFGNVPSDLNDPFVVDLSGNVPSDLIAPFGASTPAVVGTVPEVAFHDDGPIVDQKDPVDLSTPSPVSDH